jgi:hypothetical protein
MGHIDDDLSGNEKIVYRTGLHWVTFCSPALLLFLAGISIPSKGKSAIVLFVIATIWAVLSLITLRNTELGITNNRVLVWTGFPWKRLRHIALIEIADAAVYQPSLGKFLNFGKITIVSAAGKRISRRLVSAPYEFLTHLREQVEEVRGAQEERPHNDT